MPAQCARLRLFVGGGGRGVSNQRQWRCQRGRLHRCVLWLCVCVLARVYVCVVEDMAGVLCVGEVAVGEVCTCVTPFSVV